MKRLMFRILVLSVLALISTDAFALGSGTWTYGDVYLKNGERLDSVWLDMPLVQDTRLKVKLDDKKHVIEADSIDCIILWSKKYPEEKHLFKSFRHTYMNLKDGTILTTKDPIWLCLQQVAPHCSRWEHVGRPSFKKGRLVFNHNKMYSYASWWYVMKNTMDAPCHIPDKEKDSNKWIKLFFGDDPVLMERFDAGVYDRKDWGYKYKDVSQIIKEYTPVKPMLDNVIPVEAVEPAPEPLK